MSDVQQLENFNTQYRSIKAEIAKVIVGQDEVVQDLLISIFCQGHCLLVGVPGLAKTLLVNTVGKVMGLSTSRIQFTPDLMPSDIIGSEILNEQRQFQFVKGPLFANLVLADEINRTPPKTQSALLEAMQEKSVTAAGKNYPLPAPFFVLATQNPIEQEGTYPLPEAQLDRFMFMVELDYPTFEQEIAIVKSTTGEGMPKVDSIFNAENIIAIQQLIRKIPVADNVLSYAVELASKTRPGTLKSTELVNKYIAWGAGPRASQYLVLGAKCHAAIHGKYSPDIDDVKAVAKGILRHRVMPNYKAEADGLRINNLLDQLI